MIRLSLTCVLFLIFAVCGVLAQTADDNIVIDQKTETYTYTNSAGSLILVEQSNAGYRTVTYTYTIHDPEAVKRRGDAPSEKLIRWIFN